MEDERTSPVTGPAAAATTASSPSTSSFTMAPQETEDPHAARPAVLQPDGAPFRRWMLEHIKPTLVQGMRLLKTYEPKKALKSLGEYFLGNDIITGCEKAGFHREGLAQIVLEAAKALSQMEVKPEEPKKWFGNYLLARSAELEV